MPKEDDAIDLYHRLTAHCRAKINQAAAAGIPINDIKSTYYRMIQEAQGMMNSGNDADALWVMNYLIDYCDRVDQVIAESAGRSLK